MITINSEIKIESPEFIEFVNREFEKTAAQASIEELAEYAFGSVEEALIAFKENKAL